MASASDTGTNAHTNQADMRKIIEWLERLPNEQLDSHPDLSLYYARALLHGGELESADRRLRELENVLRTRLAKQSTVEDRLLLATTYAFRTTVASVSSEPMDALNLGREALDPLPSENMDIRAYTLNAMGVAHYHFGSMAEAVRLLTEGGALARKAGVLYPMMAAAAFQAEALMAQGQLRQAGQVLRQALDDGAIPKQPTQSWTPVASLICAHYGRLLYEWNRLEECDCYLNEAIELGQQHAFGRPVWLAYHTLIRVRLAFGDREGALAMLKQLSEYQRLHSLLVPERLSEATQVDAWLALGKLEDAEPWVRSRNIDPTSPTSLIREFESVISAQFYLSRREPGMALVFLDYLRANTEASDRQGHLIEILALTALAQHALGEARQSVETLQRALQLAEPEGYVRMFVDMGQPMAALLYQTLAEGVMPDYIRRLLATFPADKMITTSSLNPSKSAQIGLKGEQLIEPLSERELEVLQLMASGASNQTIAEALVIAVTTAKKHVSNIIRKLGVDNRTHAVTKGRNLGLCE